MEKRPILIITAVVLMIVSVTWADTIYVDDDAPAGGDGVSWNTAYRFLQDGLAEANQTDGAVEIRVAQGVYKPDRSSSAPAGTGDREVSFVLGANVVLKGGYAGIGAPDPNLRDIENHATVLSGDLAGDDAVLSQTSDLFDEPFADEPTRLENSKTVLEIAGAAELNGVVVCDGYFLIPGYWEGYGEPLYQNGGGIRVLGDNVIIADCVFRGNYAEELGGAIFSEGHQRLVIQHCLFERNGAGMIGGGGGYIHGGDNELVGCEFRANWALQGGGLYLSVALSAGGVCKLTQCVFENNEAVTDGGAVRNGWQDTLLMENCRVCRNTAGVSGGGIWNRPGSRVVLEKCLFCSNVAGKIGGAIGTINCASILARNCTAYGNVSPEGKFLGDQSDRSAKTAISNCIARNGHSEIKNRYASVVVSYSNIQGGQEEQNDPHAMLSWGPGNIDLDPLFADPNSCDVHLKSQAGRWDPASESWVQDEVTSPCIDAGDPNSPIMYEPFPNGGIINMGAYGGTAEASKSYFGDGVCEMIITGDLNGDCRVDINDLLLLISHWTDE